MHRFNDRGFAPLEQVTSLKGRPPILKGEQLREWIDVALSSPLKRRLPFSNWSVPKLAEHCHTKWLLPSVTDNRVRAAADAPRAPERSAHSHLEALARPGLRQ